MTQLSDQLVDRIDEPGDDNYPNSVLGKAQLLLGAFGAGANHLKLTQLSQRSGVSKASAYRLAQELVHWGLLERTEDGYQLGLRMFELGQRVPVSATVRKLARPVMVDLYSSAHAIIHLGVPSGAHVLYVEKVAGLRSGGITTEIGARLPASCTASGKVLLAYSADAESVYRHLDRFEMTRLTSRSITTVSVLRHQVELVRARRYACERDEASVGFKSFSVPIMDPNGSVPAALSATVPTSRRDEEALVAQLHRAARVIGQSLEIAAEPTPRMSPVDASALGRAG